MIERLLANLAPHHCCGCGITGHLLCDNCKYDISQDTFDGCIICRRPTGREGVCGQCRAVYRRAWCVDERTDAVKRLIDAYKFHHTKAAGILLAGLLDERLPILPAETVVTPIPTIRPHVRERGYDHMVLIGRSLARRRGLAYRPLLGRAGRSVQHGASRRERLCQAKTAFRLTGTVNPATPYLIVDDIMTTGATLDAAARLLRDAGARDIWVAIVARQPLD